MKSFMFLLVVLPLAVAACGREPTNTAGAGTAGGTVTNLWTWVGGSNQRNQMGVYGTQGTPSPANVPGARQGAATWTDASGDLWLFGGGGYDSAGVTGSLNDLWRYRAGEWTWARGSNVANQNGIYGTQGIPAPGNIPGARGGAAYWIDSSGDLWLFGGSGYDSATGVVGSLNDLWKYSGGEWTWVGGPKVANQNGIYGTEGTPSPGNIPGARGNAAYWTDSSGNFWLFGGAGGFALSSTSLLYFGDLWKYSGGEWTWVAGSNSNRPSGIYGARGTPGATNIPGGRTGAAVWADTSGTVWLFGGLGTDSVGHLGELNDLWKYSAGEWTWVGGPNVINQQGIYGTKGTPAPDNIPAPRDGAAHWSDASGNLWLFGGFGITTAGGECCDLNDLWKYSEGRWTWIGGSSFTNQQGLYGTQGTPALSNNPGSRVSSAYWTDTSGNFWLFGGFGSDSTTNGPGGLNDLWKYGP